MRILKITGNKTIADDLSALQFVNRFRHQRLDLLRLGNVDGNDPAARRGEIGLEPENVAVAAEEIVGGILLVQQLHDRGLRFLKVLVEDSVLRVGALGNVDDEEAAVLAHIAIKIPVLVVLSLVNQRVF